MANYPTSSAMPQVLGSSEEWLDDLTVDQAVGGGARVRAMYPAKKRRFIVKHWCSAADRATLQTFYDTNRLLTFTFTWAVDAANYTVLFEVAPKFTNTNSPIQSDCEVRLREA